MAQQTIHFMVVAVTDRFNESSGVAAAAKPSECATKLSARILHPCYVKFDSVVVMASVLAASAERTRYTIPSASKTANFHST